MILRTLKTLAYQERQRNKNCLNITVDELNSKFSVLKRRSGQRKETHQIVDVMNEALW